MKRSPTTPNPICPVCRNSRSWRILQTRHYLWKICSRCETWVFPPSQQLNAYPAEYYGGSAAKFTGLAQGFRERFHKARARSIQRWLKRGMGTVYDVGCGDGLFLRAASSLGLGILGFEPEMIPRKQAEQRLKRRVDSTLLASRNHSGISAITCWQVIEHMRDPQGFLRTVAHALKNGGILAISTVNLHSLQARCFGCSWLHLDPPRHLWISSRKKLLEMVKAAGFQILEVRHRPLEFGPVGWVDSFFNLFDSERDRLLRCLKQGCAGPSDRLIWLLSAALTPFAVFLSVLESAIGRPATFEIYARLEKRGARRQGG